MATGIRITFALFCCQVAKDLLADRRDKGTEPEGGGGSVFVTLIRGSGSRSSQPSWHLNELPHFFGAPSISININ